MEAVRKIHTHLDLDSNEIRNARFEHLSDEPAPLSGRAYFNPETGEFRFSDGEKWFPLNCVWKIEGGKIVADGDVIIRGNLMVDQDVATKDDDENTSEGSDGFDLKSLEEYLAGIGNINASNIGNQSVLSATKLVNSYNADVVTVGDDKSITLSGAMYALRDVYLSGHIYVGGTSNLMLGRDETGIFLTKSGISWHNEDNGWSSSLMSFAKTEIRVYSMVRPHSDRLCALGSSEFQWSNIYSHNGNFNACVSVNATKRGTYLDAKNVGNAAIKLERQLIESAYEPVLAIKTYSGHTVTFGGIADKVGFFMIGADRADNGYDWCHYIDADGKLYHSGGAKISKDLDVKGNLVVDGDVASGGDGQSSSFVMDDSYILTLVSQNGYAQQAWVRDNYQPLVNATNMVSAAFVSGLATVATSGKYSDLTGLPTNLITTSNIGSQSVLSARKLVNSYNADVVTVGNDKSITLSGAMYALRDVYLSGHIYVGGTSNLMLGRDETGIFLTKSGISWHNEDNGWSSSLMSFAKTEIRVYSMVRPHSDRLCALGSSEFQWSNIYSHNGNFNACVSVNATKRGTYLDAKNVGNAAIKLERQLIESAYEPVLAIKTYSGHTVTFGGIADKVGFFMIGADRADNGYDWCHYIDADGKLYHSGGAKISKDLDVKGNLVVDGDVASGGDGQSSSFVMDDSYILTLVSQNGYAQQAWVRDNYQPLVNATNMVSAAFVSGLATVATSGKYSDLTGLPTNLITTSNIGSQSVLSATKLTASVQLWGYDFNGTQTLDGSPRLLAIDSGGWAKGYSFRDAANITTIGTYGAYGEGSELKYMYIGAAYNNAAVYIYPSNKRMSIGYKDDSYGLYVRETLYVHGTSKFNNHIYLNNGKFLCGRTTDDAPYQLIGVNSNNIGVLGNSSLDVEIKGKALLFNNALSISNKDATFNGNVIVVGDVASL